MAKINWNIALWIPQLLFAWIYFNAGRIKFTHRENWAASFRAWGYPEHFYLVIGVLEGLGGLALLHPKTAGYGFATLSIIMFGACLTHVVFGPAPNAIFTGVLTIVFALLAWARRPEWYRARLAARRTA